MGLFAFISFLIVTSIGTLYPVYLSYKAIKQNDLQSLEILLMFWIVIGTINAFENTFGWAFNWIPFFYQLKSIFMLWLTLPQIQGSTYVYVTYVHPFLLKHEVAIDQWLAGLKENIKQLGTEYSRRIIETIKEALAQAISPPNSVQSVNSAQSVPSSTQDPNMNISASYAMNLIRHYGPAAAALFQPMPNRGSFYLATSSGQTGTLQPENNDTAATTTSDGYRIPEYEELPSVLQSGRTSPNPTLRRRPTSSPHRTAGSPSGGVRPVGSNGYDEIGKDEASGSETDWLMRKPSPLPRTATGSNDKPASIRSTSSSSNWFAWNKSKKN